LRCPYGQPGVRLVLKSSWATEAQYNYLPPSKLPESARIWTLFDGDDKPEWCGRTRTARFIPKRLYHLFPKAEVLSVRVERVKDISEEDALAEGSFLGRCPCLEMQAKSRNAIEAKFRQTGCYIHGTEFRELWDSINAKRPGCSWEDDPWVWVVEFKRCA
jgi:hypothetical protein